MKLSTPSIPMGFYSRGKKSCEKAIIDKMRM